jgi:hypothetical protein
MRFSILLLIQLLSYYLGKSVSQRISLYLEKLAAASSLVRVCLTVAEQRGLNSARQIASLAVKEPVD